MKNTKIKLALFFAVLLLGLNPSIYAQEDSDSQSSMESEGEEQRQSWELDGPEPPPSAPINKALPLLVIAGVCLVYKKVYNKN